MDFPDYQRLACELAEAAWKIEAEAMMGGDAARVAKASEIADRAIAMCTDLGVDPPCPPHHPWCSFECERRDVAGRCPLIAPDHHAEHHGVRPRDGRRSGIIGSERHAG